MKSQEFLGEENSLSEGDDKNPQDVIENHPEIWEFFKKIGEWMSFQRYGQVETYETASSHMVSIKWKPSAGLENLKAILDSEGIEYIPMASGLAGTFPDTEIHWNVVTSGPRGNLEMAWRFSFPHVTEEIEEEEKDDRYHTYVYELVDYLEEYLEDIVQKYAKHATGDSMQPAAPNTAVFKANVKGMIEIVKGVTTPPEKYGFARYYPLGIKVGGNVDYKVHKAIEDEVKRLWADVIQGHNDHEPEVVKGNSIQTEKGVMHYDDKRGTSWSLYGFALS